MANYDDDDLDTLEDNGQAAEESAAAAQAGSNRNFMLAIGIIGSLFVLLTIALVVFALLILPRQRQAREATNAVILTQNVGTAVFATEQAQLAAQLLTPSATLTTTVTQVPPTATNTSVVVVASSTPTATTEVVVDARTATVAALLTQASEGRTATVVGTSDTGGGTGAGTPNPAATSAAGTAAAGTAAAVANTAAAVASTSAAAATSIALGTPIAATSLPQSGFADEVGLPGLFGLAAVLLVVIILARRLRMSPGR